LSLFYFFYKCRLSLKNLTNKPFYDIIPSKVKNGEGYGKKEDFF